MEMEVLCGEQFYLLEPGDHIMFDGVICAVKEIIDPVDEFDRVIAVSEDDRERREFWFDIVEIYGYPEVDI